MSNVTPLDAGAACAMADWGELLARISHDLRTPLNAVIGFSDVMQNELFGPLGNARYQEYARHIRQSGDQLLQATENTLAMTSMLATPAAIRLDDLRLEDLIGAAVAEQAVPASMLECKLEAILPGGVDVRGDPRLLPRAVRYLLAAAMSRAVAGARIVITAAVAHGRVALEIVVSPAGEPAPVRRLWSKETGLGRDEMAVWLARGLLERHGSTVRTTMTADAYRIETELELAAQQDFFSRVS